MTPANVAAFSLLFFTDPVILLPGLFASLLFISPSKFLWTPSPVRFALKSCYTLTSYISESSPEVYVSFSLSSPRRVLFKLFFFFSSRIRHLNQDFGFCLFPTSRQRHKRFRPFFFPFLGPNAGFFFTPPNSFFFLSAFLRLSLH